jgi:hypothetical protein
MNVDTQGRRKQFGINKEPAGPQWTKIETSEWATHETTGVMLLWCEDWVDEEFNPSGIKAGYFQEGDVGEAHFNVAGFIPDQDEYISLHIYDPELWPTHWMPEPEPPLI